MARAGCTWCWWKTQRPNGKMPLWPLIATLAAQTLATMALFSLPAIAPAVAQALGVRGELVGVFVSVAYGTGIVSAVLSPGGHPSLRRGTFHAGRACRCRADHRGPAVAPAGSQWRPSSRARWQRPWPPVGSGGTGAAARRPRYAAGGPGGRVRERRERRLEHFQLGAAESLAGLGRGTDRGMIRDERPWQPAAVTRLNQFPSPSIRSFPGNCCCR
jgi:hypothetical protein